MLKLLLAASLMLAPVSPAVPQAAIPADTIARAKAPLEDARMVDALAELNRFVNDNIQGTSDQEHYGVPDFWVMVPADGKGDCEDYVLSKIYMLEEAGFPI